MCSIIVVHVQHAKVWKTLTQIGWELTRQLIVGQNEIAKICIVSVALTGKDKSFNPFRTPKSSTLRLVRD